MIGSYSATTEPPEYDEPIEVLEQQLLDLIEESARSQTVEEEFDQKYRIITDQIKELRKKKAKSIRERQLAEAYDQRVREMEQYTKKISSMKREFDDELVRRLLKTVRVMNENKIEIQFRSGIVMVWRLDFEE